MDHIFQDFILHLPSCRDRRDIESLLGSTIQDYGLNHFAYVSFPAGGEADTPNVLTTYPASWMARYAENRYDRIDPVIARAVGTMLPFTWTIGSFREPMSRKQKAFPSSSAVSSGTSMRCI
jgi:LuxR family transcriptional regulator, activator of conjugal transfer of Ti plasmids